MIPIQILRGNLFNLRRQRQLTNFLGTDTVIIVMLTHGYGTKHENKNISGPVIDQGGIRFGKTLANHAVQEIKLACKMHGILYLRTLSGMGLYCADDHHK